MKANKRLSVGVMIACLALLGGAIIGGTADAKKKKKGGKTKTALATTAGGLIPSATGGPPPTAAGVLAKTLTIGKKFKKKTADLVTVTYSATGTAGVLDDVSFQLTAPNGRTVGFGNPAGPVDAAIGPVTESPNSSAGACSADTVPPPPPCFFSSENRVLAPYSSEPIQNPALAFFTGVPIKGTWTVKAFNLDPATGVGGGTATLGTVSIAVTPQKPVV